MYKNIKKKQQFLKNKKIPKFLKNGKVANFKNVKKSKIQRKKSSLKSVKKIESV